MAWTAASAAQLPVKVYTTADGLARNQIECIVQDPRGFLWFCTTEGVSRFDGYTFINYGAEHGLPHRVVTNLLISRRGDYWVGTSVGLFRLDPKSASPQRFEPARLDGGPQSVRALLEDRSRAIWVSSEAGLFRLATGQSTWESVDIGMPKSFQGLTGAYALLEDRRGALWIAAPDGLRRRTPDGHTVLHQNPGSPGWAVKTLYEDREGRIWASDNKALYQLNSSARPEDPIVNRAYTMKDHLPTNRIVALLESSDGRFWAGGSGGLSQYLPATDKFESYTTQEGLSDHDIYSLAEDKEGNLWVGTNSGGAVKIARRGFTSYTAADGLGDSGIASVFVDRAGELCASRTYTGFLDCFTGKRFTTIRPKYPDTIQYFGWATGQTAFQDHTGEWWVPTGEGLCRFGNTRNAEQLSRRSPKAVYTTRDGLSDNNIFRLFEDSQGDIWISTADHPRTPLTRWERTTGQFHIYTRAEGFPDVGQTASAFAEDRSGQLWVGLFHGGLLRHWKGHFTLYSESDGLPAGLITSLYLDHEGRLWIGSYHGGLSRIDNPSEAKLRFVTYTTADGLSDNAVLCLTEDQWGRIYACTGRGIDRLDPATGHIKYYTTADGLARGELAAAGRDRQGALWFGSLLGFSRLVPEPDEPAVAPPVLIMGLRVQGVSRPVSEFGQSTVSGLLLQPNQNQLQFDFVGLGFAPGERIRYQYRLNSADRDWRAPTELHSVIYAGLRPGSYIFQVRAVNVQGVVSPQPASVTFSILAPVWQRWWFVTAAATALSILIYSLYRYRLAQLLAVERIRARIATDLHDDIGSSLSQISILSELVRQRLNGGDPRVSQPLAEISNVSSEMVASLSDIVWAINPRHDRVSDLSARMRRFAFDVLQARGIELRFKAEGHQERLRTSPDFRRQVYLIFKEAVNNSARHAGCTKALIELHVGEGRLELRLSDNGRGIEPSCAGTGNGLVNMRKRAADLGGRLEIKSEPGHGTDLTLCVPLPGSGAP
jgi:ligand-binding sensor domain-containing protein/signal transduction histidine kinase